MRLKRPAVAGAGRRRLKDAVRQWLNADDFDAALADLLAQPLRPLTPHLIAHLPSADERLKDRAIAALGSVVSRLARENIEAARDVVRRLHWSLTEEAGAIGWGAPEALGEILARHDGLAREYAALLVSYLREDGNLLDHPPLLRGAIRGVCRAARAHPAIFATAQAAESLTACASSADPGLRNEINETVSMLAGLTPPAAEQQAGESPPITEPSRPKSLDGKGLDLTRMEWQMRRWTRNRPGMPIPWRRAP